MLKILRKLFTDEFVDETWFELPRASKQKEKEVKRSMRGNHAVFAAIKS
jgi:hypothetical protein